MNITQITHVTRELKTLRDMLRWSLSEFNRANLYYGHGTDNAWDEAVYLNLTALHLPPDTELSALLDAVLLESERRSIVDLIQRRVTERRPAAYLSQEAWFAGLSFYVDERVIIPRSPIAELIARQYEPWIKSETGQPLRILDLCTGSGCIAIASALAIPDATVDAVDISSDALAVATLNVEKYTLSDRVRLIQSDLFEQLTGQIYDVIVSNPPYVSGQEYDTLPHEYRHEPKVSLYADDQGLGIVKIILREAGKHLSPDGILIVEVGNSAEALIAQYPKIPFVWLEFEQGESEVFLLTAEQLAAMKV